jgi:undecaprenyl-diphosphatase
MISSVGAFDLWFEKLMLSIRTPLGLQIFNTTTLFGELVTIVGIAGVIAVALWSSREYRPYVVGLAVTLLGAMTSVYMLKDLIMRARPTGMIPAILETSSSFPSGHATFAMALYGFIIFLFYKLYPTAHRAILVVAVVLIIAVGFSRLYLGVHYPSDVVAGFMLGGVWVALGLFLTKKLQKCT